MTDGLILIDKPSGFTSFDVIAKLRRALGTRHVGHTGTLDPLATGVLPLLTGRACRLSDFLLKADKRYTAALRPGTTTDSYDITGQITSTCPHNLTENDIAAVLPEFTGDIMQKPPIFSAIQKNGERLYNIARRGGQTEIEPRPVTIHSIELCGTNEHGDFLLDIKCSKGTYIRSLCHDIGERLGVGGCVAALRRTQTGSFTLDDCVSIEAALESPVLLPPDRAVQHLENIMLTENQRFKFVNGAGVKYDNFVQSGALAYYRIYDEQQTFLGIGYIDYVNCVLKSKVVFPADE